VGDIADEIGLCPRWSNGGSGPLRSTNCQTNRENQRTDEQAQCPFDRIGGPGQGVRIQQINRPLPNAVILRRFRSPERPLPIDLNPATDFTMGLALSSQNGTQICFPERGLVLHHELLQAGSQAWQGQCAPELPTPISRRPVPEEQVELVIDDGLVFRRWRLR